MCRHLCQPASHIFIALFCNPVEPCMIYKVGKTEKQTTQLFIRKAQMYNFSILNLNLWFAPQYSDTVQILQFEAPHYELPWTTDFIS